MNKVTFSDFTKNIHVSDVANNINFADYKAPSFALLISRCILRLGQVAQKQQRPHCPYPKMYLAIRKADERLLSIILPGIEPLETSGKL